MRSRAAPVIACWVVALDCARRASGAESSLIYAGDFVWLWWISAFYFLAAGFLVLFEGVR